MSEVLTVPLVNRQQAWDAIRAQVFPYLAQILQASRVWILTIKPETRSEAQNRLMWPLLTAYSKQLQWPVDGRMAWMTPEEWKDVLSAGFHKETVRLAMGINGGVVMLGRRTSKFTKKQFSEWIEFLYATAADRGVSLPEWVDEETGVIHAPEMEAA